MPTKRATKKLTEGTPRVPASAASLADELRSRGDQQIADLFALRPDLTSPVPNDFSSLSARASSTPSLIRALDSLNLFQLQIAEAISALDESLTRERLVTATDPLALEALEKLWARALVYFDREVIRMPRALRELIGAKPAGLGPVSLVPIDTKRIDSLLKSAPKMSAEFMKRMTWGPAKGAIGDRRKTGGAIDWLLENELMVKIDNEHVAIPREIGIHLRGGKIHRELAVNPPQITGDLVKFEENNQAAIASVSNLLRWVSELMDFWSEETPTLLRTGGLGLRDLRKAAEHLGVDENCAAFIAELCYLQGLLAIEGDGRVLPATGFDLFQSATSEQQWRDLVSIWLESTRVIGLIRIEESKGIAPLGNELDRVWAPRVRRTILELIKGQADIAPSLESLQQRLDWTLPSRKDAPLAKEFPRWVMAEAQWLGIIGRGAISSFGHAFLHAERDLGINAALPPAVDHILIQGDNTAIAPGPLTIELARKLSTFADIESRGNATVYRFTEGSIRRGLDHGHTGDEIKNFLKSTSKTPVPQPLEYLISDVARRHGQLRVGYANTYIRCEDEATITSILKDRRLENLRLRQIAPTVLISESESGDSLETLRNSGYLPSMESQSGDVISLPKQLRAQSKARLPRAISETSEPTLAVIQAAVKVLRTGDRAHSFTASRAEIPRTTANETLAILRKSIESESTITIGYADTNGGVTQRIVDPVSIAMGNVIARDHGNDEVISFKIARITGVAFIDE